MDCVQPPSQGWIQARLTWTVCSLPPRGGSRLDTCGLCAASLPGVDPGSAHMDCVQPPSQGWIQAWLTWTVCSSQGWIQGRDTWTVCILPPGGGSRLSTCGLCASSLPGVDPGDAFNIPKAGSGPTWTVYSLQGRTQGGDCQQPQDPGLGRGVFYEHSLPVLRSSSGVLGWVGSQCSTDPGPTHVACLQSLSTQGKS